MVALIVCAGLCTRASAQELITNGGFENTDEDGVVLNWVYSGEGVGPATSAAHSGFLGMEFFSYGEPATLTQSGISTIYNHEYLVGFWLYNDEWLADYPKSFTVNFDGTLYDVGAGPTPGEWTHYSFYAAGTGNANASLQFAGQYDIGSWYLDDVSVYKTGNVVPEPSLMQLPFLLGLAGLGYWHRRRRA